MRKFFSKTKKGFTILEVMGVIVLLGLLAYLVVPNILSNSAQDSLKTKATDVMKKAGEVKQAYDLFFMRTSNSATYINGTSVALADGLVKGSSSTGGFLSMVPKFTGIGNATSFTDQFDKTNYTGFGASATADTVLILHDVSSNFCQMYNHVANGVSLGTAIPTVIGTTANYDSITGCYANGGTNDVFYLVEAK